MAIPAAPGGGPPPRRLGVGITGASGALYGVRLLERARTLGVETHLVVSAAGVLNAHHELGLDRAALDALADRGSGMSIVTRWSGWPRMKAPSAPARANGVRCTKP